MEIKDLSLAVDKYRHRQMSLDQFADWFRGVSRRKFAESEEVRNAILEIDSAFSRLDFDGIGETKFRQELANAIRPFASHAELSDIPIAWAALPETESAESERRPSGNTANQQLYLEAVA
jgi:hypothetical protein